MLANKHEYEKAQTHQYEYEIFKTSGDGMWMLALKKLWAMENGWNGDKNIIVKEFFSCRKTHWNTNNDTLELLPFICAFMLFPLLVSPHNHTLFALKITTLGWNNENKTTTKKHKKNVTKDPTGVNCEITI